MSTHINKVEAAIAEYRVMDGRLMAARRYALRWQGHSVFVGDTEGDALRCLAANDEGDDTANDVLDVVVAHFKSRRARVVRQLNAMNVTVRKGGA